jgi:hypothetical protein
VRRRFLRLVPNRLTRQLSKQLRNYPLSAFAEIVELQSHTRMSARISDLSRTGCYAEMMSPFPTHAPEQFALLDVSRIQPIVDGPLHPVGHRYSTDVSRLSISVIAL